MNANEFKTKNKIKFKQIIKLSHNIYIDYTCMLQINPSRLAKHACACASKGLKILPALAFSFVERELTFSATRQVKRNIMLEALVAFFVYIAESFTGSVLENSSVTTHCRQDQEDINNSDSQEVERLLPETDPLKDFTKFDPENASDTIFQEFDPPPGCSGSMAWKLSRPAPWKSFVMCFKTVFAMHFLWGSSIALLAITVVVLDFNIADLCYEKTFRWNSMPKMIQSIRVTGQAVEGFFIQLWHFFIMLCMFGFSTMKELNLLTINLLAAFMDVCYRLFLQVFGIYKRPWMSYPLNVLFASIVLSNSLIIAKHIIPVQIYSKTKLLKVTSVLALQFVTGIPVTFLLVYYIFPWYNKKGEIEKVLIAGASPLIISIPKVIVRAAAPKFDLVHPGVLYLLVSTLYSSSAVVFRVMQAELTNFSLFAALGLGHALVDLVERLTVTMRDYIYEYTYKLLSRCNNRTQTRNFHAAKARTPRSMRFVADVSIQLLLTEPTALVSAVWFIQFYRYMYPDGSRPSVSKLVWGYLERCITGLTIDVVVNTLSMWLQVTIFNVAILRVWNSKKKRSHLIANIVSTVVSVLYFTEYLFAIVRAKNDPHTAKRFNFNCTLPFHSSF